MQKSPHSPPPSSVVLRDPSFLASFRVESHPFAFWEGRYLRAICSNYRNRNFVVSHFLSNFWPCEHNKDIIRDWIFRPVLDMSASSEDAVNFHLPKKVSRATKCSNSNVLVMRWTLDKISLLANDLPSTFLECCFQWENVAVHMCDSDLMHLKSCCKRSNVYSICSKPCMEIIQRILCYKFGNNT